MHFKIHLCKFKPTCLELLLILFVLGSLCTSCNHSDYAGNENHDAYFDTVFKRAENYRTESITYVDSIYSVFPNPGVKDLFRKYFFLWYAHVELKKDYPTGMKYADSAIWIMRDNAYNKEYISLHARALFMKGDVFLAQKNYAEAFQYYYKGREVIQNNADSCTVTEFTNRMAMVSYRQKNYVKAIEYFKQSIAGHYYCSDVPQRFRNEQRNLNNIGLCFSKLGQHDSALYYFDKGIQIIQENKEQFPGTDFIEAALGVIYGNKGDVYYQQGNSALAEKLYSESIQINNQKNHENRDAQLTAIKLAKLYIETQRLDRANQLLQAVRRSMDTLQNELAELRWWPVQKQYYDTTHQTEKAYQLFQNYIKLRDSLNTNVKLSSFDVNKEFEGIKQKYEYGLLKKENEVKTVYLIISILFSLMALIILIMAWNNRRYSKMNERELIAAKNIAEEAAIAKQQFLSNMSHEIRTPMNAVLGMTHLLLHENPQPEQEENLKALKFASENLMVLLNDILDYSKIEAGKMVFEETDFSVKCLMESICKAHEVSAIKKNIGFAIQLDPNIPEMLMGDPVRLTQILNNLLSNAVKFTLEGWVKLTVTLQEITSNTIVLNFAVSDTGIGINTSQQESIFESFTQASSETTRQFGGTGLGLAITKRLLDLQGSRIVLSSEKDKGSTFTFALSFRKSEKEKPDHNISHTLEGENKFDLSAFTVLIVDDNNMNIMVVQKVIERWGVKIEKALSGMEALSILKTKQFDVILMDLQMPDMSGYETSMNIRSNKEFNHIGVPIIALTADVMSETRNNAIAAGMNDYISKPFNPDELHKKLLYYLSDKI